MEIHIKETINAPAEKVWDVLAHRFAEIGDWAPNIAYSRALERSEVPAGFTVAPEAPVPGRITPNPLGDLAEVLTAYSEAEKSFTFQVPGPAPLASFSENNTRVTALDAERSRVTFDLRLEPRGLFKLISPLLKRRLQTSKFGPAGMIKDLKAYVENN